MSENKNVELLVGLFLFIGLCFIAGMIVVFGSKGSQIRNSYEITVEFPNAEGLIKNSSVLLGGASIGQVADNPNLKNSYQVDVPLKILNGVQIPHGATFSVSSSGLMGDKFVNVIVPPKFDSGDNIKPGELVHGTSHGGGFEELTDKGSEVMAQLNAELKQIDTMTTTLNKKLLSDENMSNIRETVANLKTTSENLNAATKKLGTLADKADGTIDTAGNAMKTAETTMKTANGAAGDLRLAIADVRKTVGEATKTIDSAGVLVKKATDGEGTLGMLINDRKMADDLRSLVANLRRSGVLFYKDRPLVSQPQQQAQATQPPRR